MARPIWCRLLLHCVRAAASRTFCTAGSNRPMSTAMMAITTKSSIRVKATRRRGCWVVMAILLRFRETKLSIRRNVNLIQDPDVAVSFAPLEKGGEYEGFHPSLHPSHKRRGGRKAGMG